MNDNERRAVRDYLLAYPGSREWIVARKALVDLIGGLKDDPAQPEKAPNWDDITEEDDNFTGGW